MLSRRQFLQATAALSLAPTSLFATNSKHDDIILGGGQYVDLNSKQNRFVLSCLSNGEIKLSPTLFLPHGIHPNPAQPTRLAAFEKKGPGACEYDLKTKQVIRPIHTSPGRYFYGHGAYSVDGLKLFATETVLSNQQGVIAVRDSNDLDELGLFPSYGLEPHECKLIDSGKTLVVTNGGGHSGKQAPSVCYIDVASQNLKEKISLDDGRLNAGHFAISDNGQLVTVSAPRNGLGKEHAGGISLKNTKGQLERLHHLGLTDKLAGEALSVCIHNASDTLAVTHPDSHLVTFWSLKTKTLIKTLKLHKPRGIELNTRGDHFLISAGRNASLLLIAIDSLQVVAVVSEYSYFTGSHIYNWDRRLPELGLKS